MKIDFQSYSQESTLIQNRGLMKENFGVAVCPRRISNIHQVIRSELNEEVGLADVRRITDQTKIYIKLKILFNSIKFVALCLQHNLLNLSSIKNSNKLQAHLKFIQI